MIIRSATVASALAALVLVGAQPNSATQAQGIVKEDIPGGVEVMPTRPSLPAPASAPAAATVPPVPYAKPNTPATVIDQPKTKAPDAAKTLKKSKKAAPPAGALMAPRSAPAPAPVPGVPGDETKPGAVERVPAAPAQPQ